MVQRRPHNLRRRGRAAAIAALLVVATGLGCRAAFRYPAESPPDAVSADERLVDGMNPFILTDIVSDRLWIEVDWVEGARPSAEALAGLERTLLDYLPAGKRVEIAFDDEIPAAGVATAGAPAERAAALGAWLDRDPRDWANGDLVWVLSVPGEAPMLGVTTAALVERPEGPAEVDTVLLYHDEIEREAALWVGTRKIEQAILVHEFGHVLGLVADPSHVERDNPRHCTEPGCVMARHRGRSQLYNAPAALFAGKIPDDFCDRCRDDIRRAQAAWQRGSDSGPAFVDGLRNRRRARESMAEACWYARRRDWVEAASRFRRALELEGRDGAAEPGAAVSLEQLCAGEP